MERKHITIDGIVQGVGFRPFIYNLAHKHRLTGYVTNTSTGVEIEVEGRPEAIQRFQQHLPQAAPPLCVIRTFHSQDIPLNGDASFSILPSQHETSATTLIAPDVATCDDCLREIFDPKDRRYLYPFTNCTNCGPRFTIIKELPYDRAATSMANFTMCPECQAEYDNPSNRRFHAQPNACPVCGPNVTLWSAERKPVATEDPLQETVRLLKAGAIIAIKGLGGFHLAVIATEEEAVRRLRKRKHREEKPLALMVRDLAMARALCAVNQKEETLLTAWQRPIVLLSKKTPCPVAEAVAPANPWLGIMLPYTPLHHILFHWGLPPVVMTSANLTEEPICIDNEEAFHRLQDIADYFLIHDRDIYLRADDSVVLPLKNQVLPLRRSRGYAPRPIFVAPSGPPVLAVGGELKNTVCLLKDDRAFLSQHIGDLSNQEAYAAFKKTITHLTRVFETQPELIVHDRHPDYLSTRWAKEESHRECLAVQHHHAHLVSVLAENRTSEPVIGLIMDGTGYGTDGAIWGGEVLIGDLRDFQRYAHFEYMPLPGGDAAIRAPWRTAVSYLVSTFGEELPSLPLLEKHDWAPIAELVTRNVRCFPTSSCGRLFDAVAALCGGKQTIRYEGQAAMEFMYRVQDLAVRPLAYELEQTDSGWQLAVKPIIRAVVRAIQNGESLERLAARFHVTMVKLFVEIADQARADTGLKTVALSGGVFQNQVLVETLVPALKRAQFQVLTHHHVPPNDGGLALGQALIGRAYLNKQ
jgi:hydrogenase maturation protein HypF